MSPFFISDLHLSHRKIFEFEGGHRQGATIEEHDEWLIDSINSRVPKNSTMWVLGDVCFSKTAFKKLDLIRCKKMHLVRGNHDLYSLKNYTDRFNKIMGLVKLDDIWLSHAPIHPSELRGRPNAHGHVHSNSLDDPRYFNVCVEALKGVPISLDELKAELSERGVYNMVTKNKGDTP